MRNINGVRFGIIKNLFSSKYISGITIPPIVLNEVNDKFRAIDGKQRISAMRDFVKVKLNFIMILISKTRVIFQNCHNYPRYLMIIQLLYLFVKI